MGPLDILLLCLVALALVLAVRSRVRAKKNGSGCCSGSCAGCNACRTENNKKEKELPDQKL